MHTSHDWTDELSVLSLRDSLWEYLGFFFFFCSNMTVANAVNTPIDAHSAVVSTSVLYTDFLLQEYYCS